MPLINISTVTPQKKIVAVNNKFGNKGIKYQQGTTRIIYDTLTLTGTADTFRFFDGVNSRQFPDTNVGQSGTGLQVGESIAIERVYLALVETLAGNFVDVTSLVGRPDIEIGDLTIRIANTIVLKPIPLTSFRLDFNKSAKWAGYSVFEFNTSIVITPLLEFVFEVRTLVVAGTPNFALRLAVEGPGSILAPKQTY